MLIAWTSTEAQREKRKSFSSGKIEGVLVCLFSVGVKTVGFQPGLERERETPLVRVFSHPRDFFFENCQNGIYLLFS